MLFKVTFSQKSSHSAAISRFEKTISLPYAESNTDLWSVVARCVRQVNDEAQFFFLLFDFLNEVTRRKSLLWMKVLIKALKESNIQQQMSTTASL